MKTTSKKASGLLSGLDYTAQHSEIQPNTAKVQTVQRNTAEYSEGDVEKVFLRTQDTAKVSQKQQNPAQSSVDQLNTAKQSAIQPNTAKYSEGETGKKTLQPYTTNKGSKTAGRNPRITIIMKDDQRKFINREARKHGLTIGEYIYGLACAAAAGDISVDEYV